MLSLTIGARSLDSAHDLYNALSSFHPELLGNDEDGYRVSVELRSSDRRLTAVLHAVQECAAARRRSTWVELDGRRYIVQPE